MDTRNCPKCGTLCSPGYTHCDHCGIFFAKIHSEPRPPSHSPFPEDQALDLVDDYDSPSETSKRDFRPSFAHCGAFFLAFGLLRIFNIPNRRLPGWLYLISAPIGLFLFYQDFRKYPTELWKISDFRSRSSPTSLILSKIAYAGIAIFIPFFLLLANGQIQQYRDLQTQGTPGIAVLEGKSITGGRRNLQPTFNLQLRQTTSEPVHPWSASIVVPWAAFDQSFVGQTFDIRYDPANLNHIALAQGDPPADIELIMVLLLYGAAFYAWIFLKKLRTL